MAEEEVVPVDVLSPEDTAKTEIYFCLACGKKHALTDSEHANVIQWDTVPIQLCQKCVNSLLEDNNRVRTWLIELNEDQLPAGRTANVRIDFLSKVFKEKTFEDIYQMGSMLFVDSGVMDVMNDVVTLDKIARESIEQEQPTVSQEE